MDEGAKLVLKTIDAIIDNSIELISQTTETENIKLAPKLFKQTCRINWSLTSKEVSNFIRGLSPYPTAHTTLEKDDEIINIKIYEALPILHEHTLPNGTIVQPNTSQLDIAVSDGFIRILELQVQGRKRMKISDFLNGFSFKESDILK